MAQGPIRTDYSNLSQFERATWRPAVGSSGNPTHVTLSNIFLFMACDSLTRLNCTCLRNPPCGCFRTCVIPENGRSPVGLRLVPGRFWDTPPGFRLPGGGEDRPSHHEAGFREHRGEGPVGDATWRFLGCFEWFEVRRAPPKKNTVGCINPHVTAVHQAVPDQNPGPADHAENFNQAAGQRSGS